MHAHERMHTHAHTHIMETGGREVRSKVRGQTRKNNGMYVTCNQKRLFGGRNGISKGYVIIGGKINNTGLCQKNRLRCYRDACSWQGENVRNPALISFLVLCLRKEGPEN